MKAKLFLALALLTGGCQAQTILHVASCSANPCTMTALSAGSTVLAFSQTNDNIAAFGSVTDNGSGNTWCVVDGSGGCHGSQTTLSHDTGNGTTNGIAILNNSTSGATSVNFGWTLGTVFAEWIVELTGTNTTTPIDIAGQLSTQSSAAPTGPSLTTTNANDVVFNQVVAANTLSAVGGGCSAQGSPESGDIIASRTVTSTGTYACTWTQTAGAWSSSGIAIKAAGGGPTLPAAQRPRIY